MAVVRYCMVFFARCRFWHCLLWWWHLHAVKRMEIILWWERPQKSFFNDFTEFTLQIVSIYGKDFALQHDGWKISWSWNFCISNFESLKLWSEGPINTAFLCERVKNLSPNIIRGFGGRAPTFKICLINLTKLIKFRNTNGGVGAKPSHCKGFNE
jgi:hypothetical protein